MGYKYNPEVITTIESSYKIMYGDGKYKYSESNTVSSIVDIHIYKYNIGHGGRESIEGCLGQV